MIKKCLFPAAGYGTRFLPATKATPKEMLPVLTKPLIQYGVEEALADDLCTNGNNGVLKQMIKVYEKYQCSIIAIEEVPMDQTHKYGVIAGNLVDNTENTYRVTDMVEKPDPKDAPTNMAIIGRYILTPDIFDILRETKPGKNGEIQITDALLEQAKNGKVIAYKFDGQRFDCGSVDGFVQATNYFYETRGDY